MSKSQRAACAPKTNPFPTARCVAAHGSVQLHVNGEFVAPFFLMTSSGALRHLKAMGLTTGPLMTLELRDERNDRSPIQWWTAADRFDFTLIDQCLETLVQVVPDVWVVPRIMLDPPADWMDAHPHDLVEYADPKSWEDVHGWGGPRKPSWASAAWRRDAAKALRALIRHAGEQPYAARIIGWHLGSGVYGEWHWPNPVYYPDTSDVFRDAYGAWLQQHYPEKAPEPRIPSVAERRTATHGWLRDPVRDRWLIDYARFLHETGASALMELAAVAKEETNRRSLVVAFNGYLPDLGINHEGDHRAFDHVLHCPDLDIFASPHTYGRRKLGEDAMYRGYLGSVRRHGKLWLDENDDRTHLTTIASWQRAHTHVTTEPESVAILWRGFAHALTQGCGLWFMDQKGMWEGEDTPGWYGSPGQIVALNRMYEEMTRAVANTTPRTAAVAVISDLEAPFYIADTAQNDRELLFRMNSAFMGALNRAGAPFDLFQGGDLDEAALAGYQVLIFLDVFHLSADGLARVEAFQRAGKTCLFLGVPGCISDHDFSLERTRRLCVPEAKRAEFDRLLAPDTPEKLNERSADEAPWQTGNTWYVPGPVLSPDPLRRIYGIAGVHVWEDSSDVLMAGCGYVAVHAVSSGTKRLTAPAKQTWTDVRTGQVLVADCATLEYTLARGETLVCRLDP